MEAWIKRVHKYTGVPLEQFYKRERLTNATNDRKVSALKTLNIQQMAHISSNDLDSYEEGYKTYIQREKTKRL